MNRWRYIRGLRERFPGLVEAIRAHGYVPAQAVRVLHKTDGADFWFEVELDAGNPWQTWIRVPQELCDLWRPFE